MSGSRSAAATTGALLAAGAATAVAVVVVHPVWWGLLLGICATTAGVLALPAGWTTRLPYGGGFAATVGWLTPSRAEGDYLVGGDLAGYTLLGFTLVVAVLTLATLPRRDRHEGGADPSN